MSNDNPIERNDTIIQTKLWVGTNEKGYECTIGKDIAKFHFEQTEGMLLTN